MGITHSLESLTLGKASLDDLLLFVGRFVSGGGLPVEGLNVSTRQSPKHCRECIPIAISAWFNQRVRTAP
jgi:hypothetical protein